MERIRSCRRDISQWKRENPRNSANKIVELTKIIDEAHTDGVTSIERLNELRKYLLREHLQEEKYWKLKSRNHWLKEDDLNTKFYHATTKNIMARHRITHIMGSNGENIYGNQDIATEAEKYFGSLFTSSNPTCMDYVMNHVQPTVSNEINADLVSEVTEDEIRRAIFDIGATRAP